jgi:hypothetical protein
LRLIRLLLDPALEVLSFVKTVPALFDFVESELQAWVVLMASAAAASTIQNHSLEELQVLRLVLQTFSGDRRIGPASNP